MPYVQFELVGDFIPETRCSKFVVGFTNEKEKDGVYEGSGWALVGRTESD